MKRIRVVLLAALVAPAIVHAQGWQTLPNGEHEFSFDYTVAGQFLCGTVDVASCVSNADGSILLSSGDATFHLAVDGASGTATATNAATTIQLGAISAVYGGSGPFVFPWGTTSLGSYSFRFFLTLSPAGTWRYGGLRNGSSSVPLVCCGAEEPSALFMRFGSTPPGVAYSGVAFYEVTPAVLTGQTQTIPLSATMSLIPEPATLALVGTGLLGLCAVRRRMPSGHAS